MIRDLESVHVCSSAYGEHTERWGYPAPDGSEAKPYRGNGGGQGARPVHTAVLLASTPAPAPYVEDVTSVTRVTQR